MLRIVQSAFWFLGVLALGAAIVYPLYRDVSLGFVKREVETAVTNIARNQRLYFDRRGSFLLFRAGQANELEKTLRDLREEPVQGMQVAGFRFEALGSGGGLTIRAFPDQNALKDGSVPPMLFEYRAASPRALPGLDDPLEGGEWHKLSGQSASLLSMIGL